MLDESLLLYIFNTFSPFTLKYSRLRYRWSCDLAAMAEFIFSRAIFWYTLTICVQWKSTIMDLIIALFGWLACQRSVYLHIKGFIICESVLLVRESILNKWFWQLYWVDLRKFGEEWVWNHEKTLNYLIEIDTNRLRFSWRLTWNK